MSNIQLRMEVLTASDLKQPSRREELIHINKLINDAYWINGHPDDNNRYPENPAGPRFTTKRIETEDQLIHELGEQGILAVCSDESILEPLPSTNNSAHVQSPGYTPGRYGKTVGVASMKPWAGKTLLLFEKAQAQAQLTSNGGQGIGDVELSKLAKQYLAEQTAQKQTSHAWEWEISTCAVPNNPQYRGQGVLTKCVDALIEHLRLRQEQMRATRDPRGSLPIHLWVTALVGSPNPAYWARRGFTNEGGPDRAAVGMWTATREFEIQTMKRVLP